VLGSTDVLLKKMEDAERELSRAADLNPNEPETHYYLGRLYFARNKFPLAMGEFSKMLQLDPSSLKAYDNLGVTRQATGHFEGAEADFKRAIDLSRRTGTPSEWPYINLGKLITTREPLIVLAPCWHKPSESIPATM